MPSSGASLRLTESTLWKPTARPFQTYECHLSYPRLGLRLKRHQQHSRQPTPPNTGDTSKQHGCRFKCRAAAEAAGDDAWPLEPSSATASTASMPQTVFNLVNVIMGAGYVSIPFALKQGGWAALGVLWLLGLFFCYTGHALLQCCRKIEQQQQQQQQPPQREHGASPLSPSQAQGAGGSKSDAGSAAAGGISYTAGYEDVAAAAFGPVGKVAVSAIMYAELLGICCVYVTLEVRTETEIKRQRKAELLIAETRALLLAVCYADWLSY